MVNDNFFSKKLFVDRGFLLKKTAFQKKSGKKQGKKVLGFQIRKKGSGKVALAVGWNDNHNQFASVFSAAGNFQRRPSCRAR